MNPTHTVRVLSLLIGDIAALYASLFVTLLVRYGSDFYPQFRDAHAAPFSIVFAIWIVVFYIAGVYDIRRLRNNLDFFKTLLLALSANLLLAITFFYLSPVGIAPRTNLFIFAVVFALLELSWRKYFNEIAARGTARSDVVLAGASRSADELASTLAASPQMGYDLVLRITDTSPEGVALKLRHATPKTTAPRLIVVSRELARHPRVSPLLYEFLTRGLETSDIASFSERIMRKVPLDDLEENWFLEHLPNQRRLYDNVKRAIDVACAVLLQILLLPAEALIALAVAIFSPGPIIYSQTRVGAHGRPFTLYKFRTMRTDAEANGAQWKSGGASDPRLTRIGRILVSTHLDELPQLINVLKGNLSFVGPRPERPEFVSQLEKEIPHYNVRLLAKPGITGWAQINYRYAASTKDAYEKLQYDVYYLKNRGFILDLAIILKTIKAFFVNQK